PVCARCGGPDRDGSHHVAAREHRAFARGGPRHRLRDLVQVGRVPRNGRKLRDRMAKTERRGKGGRRMNTILITGANTGIGAAAAIAMARPGRRLILACRSETKTRPVLERIVAAGAEGTFLELDLGDLAKAQRAASLLAAREERLDLMIENAGLAGKRGV